MYLKLQLSEAEVGNVDTLPLSNKTMKGFLKSHNEGLQMKYQLEDKCCAALISKVERFVEEEKALGLSRKQAQRQRQS